MSFKKNILILSIYLMLFPFLTVLGQKGEPSVIVEYKYSNPYYSNIETLFSNQKEAVYVRPSLDQKNDDEGVKLNKEGSYVLPLKFIKASSVSYFMNSKDNFINEYTVNLDNQRFVVRDTSIVLSWKIDKSSTKTISNYKCFKATTSFRGRNYVAYYTEDIPLPYGPFKFKGLPGLILELQNMDSDIKHYWIASSIKSLDKMNLPKLSDFNASTLNAYQMFLMNQKIKKGQLDAENARLPQGVAYSHTSTVNLSIEKIFEWEIPENDKKKN